MAENKKENLSGRIGPVNPRGEKEKLIRVLLFAGCFAALVALIVFAMIALRKVLFLNNPRLTLRETVVRSVGYWENRGNELASRLNLLSGRSLFGIDPGLVRDQLRTIPCVDYAEVTRELPDRLVLHLVERQPRAVIGNPRSRWVVDEKGVIFPRLESACVVQNLSLPVIVGADERNFRAGSEAPKLKPALELIMLTLHSFPDIEIVLVDIRPKNKLRFFMRYRRVKVCTVMFPVRKGGNPAFLLSALQSAIIRSEQFGENNSTFDLSFDGSVVIR